MVLELYLPAPPNPYRAYPAYSPDAKAAVKAAFGYDNVQVYESEEPEALSDFGTPVFMPFKFEATDYQRMVNQVLQSYTTPDLFVPIIIIEAERDKNSEFTPIEGRDGTVEEFGGFGDWTGTIKGIVASTDGTYPDDQVKSLSQIANAAVPVEIACEYLTAEGVFTISLTKFKKVAMPGYTNVQAFEFNWRQQNTVYLKLAGEL